METFRLGSLTLWSFGTVMAGATALAVLVMHLLRDRAGCRRDTPLVLSTLAIPLSVLLARIGWWLCSLDWLRSTALSFWSFSDGGYMLYGALLGGALAALITSRFRKEPFGRVADLAAAPYAIVIAAARFAEYLTGNGYGSGVVEWFDPLEEWSMIAWEDPSPLCRFPFAVQNFYGTWRFSINFWEGLAALVFLIVLLRMKKRKPGAGAILLLLMYAACQIVFESMRRDEVLRWSFVRINQLLSAVLVLGLLVLCWQLQPAEKRSGRELALRLCGLLVCVGIVMLMEFVLDQKVSFLLWIRADLSYLIDIAACAGMLLLVLPLWRRAFPEQRS